MKKIFYLLLLSLLVLPASALPQEDILREDKTLIYVIPLMGNVNSTTWTFIRNGFEEAEELNADHIIIHMNTYGGEVLFADSIRTRVLNSHIHTIVFVDNNAASAGALIAVAADKVFMRRGSNMGAATVVTQVGEEAPDKFQSYLRATMRSTAVAHGKDTIITAEQDTIVRWRRDPLIAEAMVDSRVVVPGLIDSTRVLTFTAEEAMTHNFSDGIAESITEIIEVHLNISDYVVKHFRPTVWHRVQGFLMSPFLQGILIMIIIAGIYFEMQSPGIGFPLLVSITAALLYFAPLYIEGLAANWEIILFILGVVLLIVEIFVTPGFGFIGISGLLMIVTGLTLSLVGNVNFDFSGVEMRELSEATLTVIISLMITTVLLIYTSSRIGAKGMFKRVAMLKTLDNNEGYIAVPTEQVDLIGETAVTVTVLRLSGKVMVKGKIYDAVSEDGFMEKDTPVRIVRYETGQIYVVKTGD